MFSNFFRYDSPIMMFFGKLCDLMIINVLWVLCSLPIFTIGASTTAMYYVTLRLVRGEDGYTVQSFFKSFKQNFKQATAIWGILALSGLIIGVDLYYYLKISTSSFRMGALVIFSILGLIWYTMMLYVFPLLARFDNPIRQTVLNAILISLRHLPKTFVMILGDGGILFVVLCVVPGLMIFGLPLIAFYNSFILTPIFRIYSPEEAFDEEDEYEE